jgi:hypothetical protein
MTPRCHPSARACAVPTAVSLARRLCPIGSNGPTDYRVGPGDDGRASAPTGRAAGVVVIRSAGYARLKAALAGADRDLEFVSGHKLDEDGTRQIPEYFYIPTSPKAKADPGSRTGTALAIPQREDRRPFTHTRYGIAGVTLTVAAEPTPEARFFNV